MTETALSVAQVLWEERNALARTPSRAPGGIGGDLEADSVTASGAGQNTPRDNSEIYRRLNNDNHWALCLSGGGIRSAAFALGVIQRLAAQRVAPKTVADEAGSALQQFEYLSTVSGGGYIGSWLSAWLYQERQKRGAGGANQVVRELAHRAADNAEAGAIASLRRDSHYLAPSFSAISPDLWSDIAAIARNLCLNWLLLVPPMILAVLFTKAASYAFIDALSISQGSPGFKAVMVLATIGFVTALSFSVANRPARGLINASQSAFLAWDMAIFLISTALLVFVLASHNGRATLTHIISDSGFSWVNDFTSQPAVVIRGAILGAGVYAASWIVAAAWRLLPGQKPQPRLDSGFSRIAIDMFVDGVSWCIAGAAFGALTAAGYLTALAFVPDDPMPQTKLAALVCTFSVPWIVSSRIVADVVFVSFARFIPGADAGLEYQARSSGILSLAQLGWFIWFGLVLWSPIIAHDINVRMPTAWLAAAGSLSGAFALIAGFYSKAAEVAREAAKLRQYISLNTLAGIAAAIFAAILVAGLSIAMEWAFAFDPFDNNAAQASWQLIVMTSAALFVFILAASFVIGINQYSLHGLYRNRLVRAFLGASREEKKRDVTKNRFTDFDSLDSPLLHQLWPGGVNPRGDEWRPLHVINAAVNLVSSKNLAWQERMAAPFTFSPLHCGSGSSIFADGAYRRTHQAPDQSKPYGGRFGVSLGTAMAISGAAVSPNMGYNSSPGVAFLMTLFNVRLGWWLSNPRTGNTHYWLNSPRVALRPYFMEMFGLTSENERWVYLSDGGHFDNLGLYEMVRRRCRMIVVSDAGADPDYTFDDLGNALRKIWIDLGVRIDMEGLDRLKKRFRERPTPATLEPYWAVGRIRYNAADTGGEDGWLLYLKAGLHGTEPMDVLSYAMGHPTFPHETTLNQFFSESQFESYRMLGHEVVSRAFEAAGCAALHAAGAGAGQPGATALTLDAIIERLDAKAKAPAPAPANP